MTPVRSNRWKSVEGALFCGLLLAPLWTVGAQELTLTPPQLLKFEKAVYPHRHRSEEAFVVLNFTVKADGTTEDIEAVDGFYTPPFEQAAIAAVKRWKFKAATENGVPVDWHLRGVPIRFVLVDIAAGGSAKFAVSYRSAQKQLLAHDYHGAKTTILKVLDQHDVKLLYEYALAQVALSVAEFHLGDRQAALNAIRHATLKLNVHRERIGPATGSNIIESRKQILSGAMLPRAAQRKALLDRFLYETALGYFADALETFDRLKKLGGVRAGDRLSEKAALVRETLSSDRPFAVEATLENGSWRYRPARRTFALTKVKGHLDEVRIYCTRRVAALRFQPDVAWTLPSSWGNCELDVTGRGATQFTMVELRRAGAKSP